MVTSPIQISVTRRFLNPDALLQTFFTWLLKNQPDVPPIYLVTTLYIWTWPCFIVPSPWMSYAHGLDLTVGSFFSSLSREINFTIYIAFKSFEAKNRECCSRILRWHWPTWVISWSTLACGGTPTRGGRWLWAEIQQFSRWYCAIWIVIRCNCFGITPFPLLFFNILLVVMMSKKIILDPLWSKSYRLLLLNLLVQSLSPFFLPPFNLKLQHPVDTLTQQESHKSFRRKK